MARPEMRYANRHCTASGTQYSTQHSTVCSTVYSTARGGVRSSLTDSGSNTNETQFAKRRQNAWAGRDRIFFFQRQIPILARRFSELRLGRAGSKDRPEVLPEASDEEQRDCRPPLEQATRLGVRGLHASLLGARRHGSSHEEDEDEEAVPCTRHTLQDIHSKVACYSATASANCKSHHAHLARVSRLPRHPVA
jgi:hypothetical protein